MTQLRPEEEWARQMVAQDLGDCTVRQHDDGRRPGMHDLDIFRGGRRVAAVEVPPAQGRFPSSQLSGLAADLTARSRPGKAVASPGLVSSGGQEEVWAVLGLTSAGERIELVRLHSSGAYAWRGIGPRASGGHRSPYSRCWPPIFRTERRQPSCPLPSLRGEEE